MGKLEAWEVEDEWQWMLEHGADPDLMYISAIHAQFNDSVTMQGELSRWPTGWRLEAVVGKDAPGILRYAMAKASVYSGLVARHILECHLWPSSYEDLLALFELYPDSVVELSACSFEVGTVPGRNTIIWEVRNY